MTSIMMTKLFYFLNSCCIYLMAIVGNCLFAQSLSDFLQADFQFINGSLADESDNMLDASGFDLSTVTGWDGISNSALSFNGTSSYVDGTAADRNISDKITISAWFKTTLARRQVIVSKYEMAADAGFSLGMLNDGAVSLEGRDGSGNFYLINSGSYPVVDNQWHHIVGVIDQNNWKLYVDCQLLAELTTTTDTPDLTNSNPLTIGKLSEQNNEGEDRYFKGEIDNVRIYNYPLSENQLDQLAPLSCSQDEIDLVSGLIAYYPLNGDATDQSGNELHGMLNGPVTGVDRFDLNGSALLFDGEDDHILVENDPLLNLGTGNFAMSLWVKSLDPDGGPQMLVHKGISGTGGQYWFRQNEYDPVTRLGAAVTEGNPPGTFLSSTEPIFDDQEWHHLVFQRTAAALEIWVDSELKVRLLDTRYRNVDNDGNLIIGAQNPWPVGGNFPFIHNHFHGYLDEVRLYNRSLSSKEITAVSNTHCPTVLVIDENPIYSLYQAEDTLSTFGMVSLAQPTIFKAGNSVKLLPGFWTPNGTAFTALISECTPAVPASMPVPREAIALLEQAVSPLESSFLMHVAPNPAQSNIRVSLQLDEPVTGNLELLDMTGRPVKILFIGRDIDEGSQTFETDLTNLPTGFYVLRFQSEKGMLSQKIIKNR